MSLRSIAMSLVLLTASPAFAGVGAGLPELSGTAAVDCPCQADRAKLEAFRDELANAKTPEEAKSMALRKVDVGHKAIKQAAKVMPGQNSIVEADAKLTAFEDSIAQAGTQQEVADRFDGLMARPTGVGCQYDTVEILVIVIGFLLGVIPGIIFLFLFC